MPAMWGHDAKKKKLLGSMPEQFKIVFEKLKLSTDISVNDFPKTESFARAAESIPDWKKRFPNLNKKMMKNLQRALDVEIPSLLKQMPITGSDEIDEDLKEDIDVESMNPWGDTSKSDDLWLIDQALKSEYDAIYYKCPGSDTGLIKNNALFPACMTRATGAVDKGLLGAIWSLVNKECCAENPGLFNDEAFAVMMYMIDAKKKGDPMMEPLPKALPKDLVPPSLRAWDSVR